MRRIHCFRKIPIEATESGGDQWRTYPRLDAMSILGFYLGIAGCSLKMGHLDEVGNRAILSLHCYPQVLMWLDEACCLVLSTRFALGVPLFG